VAQPVLDLLSWRIQARFFPVMTQREFMIAIWLLAIYTAGVAYLVYGLQVKLAYPGFAAPRVRVGTFVDAPVTLPHAALGLESRAGQRRHWDCRRADAGSPRPEPTG
jgi:hypothetical protein